VRRTKLYQELRTRLLASQSPPRLAWAVALGVTVGLAPLAWGTTLICLLLAVALRLPVMVVQAGNYVVYPLQIALFFPFLAVGQHLLAPGRQDALQQVRQVLAEDPLTCLRLFWQVNLRGLAVWLVVAPLLLWVAERLTRRLLNHVVLCRSESGPDS
jgi:uncharacterized protein (DUF2062 family)